MGRAADPVGRGRITGGLAAGGSNDNGRTEKKHRQCRNGGGWVVIGLTARTVSEPKPESKSIKANHEIHRKSSQRRAAKGGAAPRSPDADGAGARRPAHAEGRGLCQGAECGVGCGRSAAGLPGSRHIIPIGNGGAMDFVFHEPTLGPGRRHQTFPIKKPSRLEANHLYGIHAFVL